MQARLTALENRNRIAILNAFLAPAAADSVSLANRQWRGNQRVMLAADIAVITPVAHAPQRGPPSMPAQA